MVSLSSRISPLTFTVIFFDKSPLAMAVAIAAAQIALAAACGAATLEVFRRPRLAILATGDELVPVNKSPAPGQIRNSNAYSLAAQVARAGGVPRVLPVARDTLEHTREIVERGRHDELKDDFTS